MSAMRVGQIVGAISLAAAAGFGVELDNETLNLIKNAVLALGAGGGTLWAIVPKLKAAWANRSK